MKVSWVHRQNQDVKDKKTADVLVWGSLAAAKGAASMGGVGGFITAFILFSLVGMLP